MNRNHSARRRRTSAALGVVLSLGLLVGCSDDEPKDDAASATPSPSASTPSPSETGPTDTDFGAPATGSTVRGKGFTLRMPKGWRRGKPLAGEPAVGTVLEESSAGDGFRDNVTVAHQTAPAGATLDELEASVPSQLGETVPNVDVQPRVVIRGTEALHYRGAARVGTVRYFLEEFVAIDEKGAITVITFSFSPERAAASRTKVVNQVLASWKWTKASPTG